MGFFFSFFFSNELNTVITTQFDMMTTGVLLTTDVAARGLDFTARPVDWVFQFDPPQDPSYFVHRVGRTARMGAEGSALVLLMPNELTYVDFLKVRKIPITEMESTSEVPDLLPIIRNKVLEDREIFDRSQVAFVSYIRAYKEHQCNYIFILKALPMVKLLNGFSMLKVPKMPELAGVNLNGFVPSDVSNLKYKDKNKEKQRQLKLVTAAGQNKNKTKSKRVEKAQTPRTDVHVDEGEDEDDMETFKNEARLLRKLKRGKISEREFSIATGEESDDGQDVNSVGKWSKKRRRPMQPDKPNKRARSSGGGGGGGGKGNNRSHTRAGCDRIWADTIW
eukprot:TRINITY_DN1799_c0_g2_i2.p1 TRINITY_DN1799_c0_g2~~TRINITY_DN1799_c0_g2_i2.p1  ORF type:complete len:335 (+),score=89.31 TRINITY_DN1799_c0_g2_i2:1024-2028(+)